jgi:hypothetical protein
MMVDMPTWFGIQQLYADYASAVARLVQENRAELAFFAQLPAVFSSRPDKISAGAA